ncbi:chain-length determining protein [Bacteroides thetaiotaomicron]|uniref:chain-length determining protein n=1 Tax=Bacteroides thetaiotaomicron TaxID=818 RepID=UPI004063BCA7
MTEKQSYKRVFSESCKTKDDKMEIDLIDIFHKIINVRKRLYKAAVVGLIIGIIVSLSIPKQYTVKVILSPELGTSKGGSGIAGLAASFLGTGATTSDVDALNASLSSDIITSTPFLMHLFNINVPVVGEDLTTLGSYLDDYSFPWWSYIISLPSMAVSGVKSLFENEVKELLPKTESGVIELSQEQNRKINILRRNITAIIDKKTAITNVIVTLQDPKVTAVVADSVVRRLQEYIITYRTSKAKEDCAYLENLFKERRLEYYTAQKKYAEYIDSHDNLVFQTVRAEQERLQNDMNLAYQVYSQVANQLQVSRAKVQEEKPVFAVVEPVVVPLKASGVGMMAYILLFVCVSILCTLGWTLLRTNYLNC